MQPESTHSHSCESISHAYTTITGRRLYLLKALDYCQAWGPQMAALSSNCSATTLNFGYYKRGAYNQQLVAINHHCITFTSADWQWASSCKAAVASTTETHNHPDNTHTQPHALSLLLLGRHQTGTCKCMHSITQVLQDALSDMQIDFTANNKLKKDSQYLGKQNLDTYLEDHTSHKRSAQQRRTDAVQHPYSVTVLNIYTRNQMFLQRCASN